MAYMKGDVEAAQPLRATAANRRASPASLHTFAKTTHWERQHQHHGAPRVKYCKALRAPSTSTILEEVHARHVSTTRQLMAITLQR